MKKYDAILSFSNGFYIVKLNNKCGIINERDQEICEFKYDCIYDFDFGNDFAAVKLNKKYGFINTNGNEISKIIYDDVYDFENGFAKVKLNDKWGFINEHGDEIIEIKYTLNELENKLNQYIKNHERNLKLNQLI